jgi:hypothetical protein
MASSTLFGVSNRPQQAGSEHIHDESTSRDRHSPQQGRTNTLPEATKAFRGIDLLKAVTHAVVLHVLTESIGLHLTLDNIERVASNPKSLTSQTTIGSDLQGGNFVTLNVVSLSILVHHVLKGHEPRSVGSSLTQNSNSLATEDTVHEALVGGQLLDAVNGARVQTASAVRLRLQTDTHVLNGVGKHRVSDTGEGTSHEVLCVRKGRVGVLLLVQLLETTARLVECAELDAHLSRVSEGHFGFNGSH